MVVGQLIITRLSQAAAVSRDCMFCVSGDGEWSRSDGGRRVSDDSDDQLIGIVAGAAVSVLAVLAAVIVFCVVCRRRIRKYPDDKTIVTVAPSRLPLNFPGRSDVILTSAGTTRKLSNGSVPTYGSHNSPAAALLLPPTGRDPYDEDELVKMATVSCDSPYRRPNDVLQRRQLPDLPRIPVDSAGITYSLSHHYLINHQ